MKYITAIVRFVSELLQGGAEVLAARHERLVLCHCPRPCGAIVDGARCDTGRVYRVPERWPQLPD